MTLYQSSLLGQVGGRRLGARLAARQFASGGCLQAFDEIGVAQRPAGAFAGADRRQHAIVETAAKEPAPVLGPDAQRSGLGQTIRPPSNRCPVTARA